MNSTAELTASVPTARPAVPAPVRLSRRKTPPPSNAAMIRRLAAHVRIWLPPLACETLLLGGAMILSAFFMRVQIGAPYEIFLRALAVVGTAFIGLTIWVKTRDLFMPRPVVVLGVGALALVALGLFGIGTLSGNWMGQQMAMRDRLIVLIPVGCFLLRAYLVLRGAEYAPRMEALERYKPTQSDWLEVFRRKLSFWLN